MKLKTAIALVNQYEMPEDIYITTIAALSRAAAHARSHELPTILPTPDEPRFRFDFWAEDILALVVPIGHRGKPSTVEWSRVDWSKRDLELAKDLGVTRERVRQVRCDLRQPVPAVYRRHSKTVRLEASLIANKRTITGKTIDEIRAFLNLPPIVGECLIRSACKRLQIDIQPRHDSRTRPEFGVMNFDLPNKILQEVWAMPYNAVANWRSRNNIHKAKFYDSVLQSRRSPELTALVQAEVEKRIRFLGLREQAEQNANA